jgi:PIN domain nuclease of toxin-antitoxin system
MIVLDTSALIFWTLDSAKLSAKAADIIASSDRIALSAISIWEVGIKAKQQKLTLPFSLREYTDRIKYVNKVVIVPVDERIWIKSLELDWEHRDPADRVIAATASLLECPLITSDSLLLAFFPGAVW